MKRSRLRQVSPKTAALRAQRREIVDDYLRGHPVCGWPECRRDAIDVHEPLTRARGGSIIDPTNMIGLCRDHHTWVHDHPIEATNMGLLRHSWEKP